MNPESRIQNPKYPHDWHAILDEQSAEPASVTRDRARWIVGLFALALVVIFLRAAQLEISDGANFRRLAGRPIEREVALAAQRGRILARDGTVLACDRKATALAVEFRSLENPPDSQWLRRKARARLSPAERRDALRVAAMESQIRDELRAMHDRLATLSGVGQPEWQRRCDRISRRVNALAERVNRDRAERLQQQSASDAPSDDASLATVLWGLFAPPEPLPPARVITVEETAYHRLADDVPSSVAAEVQEHPRDYPGVKIVEHTRRDYPAGTLAANLLGHVGRPAGEPSQVTTNHAGHAIETSSGLMGAELRFEAALRGTPGLAVQRTDHRGKLLATTVKRGAVAGGDVVLSIDPRLQRSAESLLDQHTRRLRPHEDRLSVRQRGGAIVVIDVHCGELLVAASAPRFDPNWFAAGEERVETVLADPARPLFDRVARMALPPGSVFKPLTALALVSQQLVDPLATFHCRGFLEDPKRLRCQLFRQQGIGHGDVMLADALAQSCNVYFFHHASALGGPRLVDWAARFGFGQPSGVELADESRGQLPGPGDLRGESHTQMLSVGQGAIAVTPLQVARLYAAIANGGYLIKPRVTHDSTASPSVAQRSRSASPPALSRSLRIGGLSDEALAAVRDGLRRAVDDPNGTAFAALQIPGLAIAGKTGTAETGGHRPDHSWFAGYLPAERPRYAFVVVLEHAGSGGETSAPIARKLIERMRQLGYIGEPQTADQSIPAGKG
jgi:penicillin-binding protein 2